MGPICFPKWESPFLVHLFRLLDLSSLYGTYMVMVAEVGWDRRPEPETRKDPHKKDIIGSQTA